MGGPEGADGPVLCAGSSAEGFVLFPDLLYFNLCRVGGGKTGDVRQNQCFHLPADNSYPHVLFAASSSSVLFCIVRQIALQRDKEQIPG